MSIDRFPCCRLLVMTPFNYIVNNKTSSHSRDQLHSHISSHYVSFITDGVHTLNHYTWYNLLFTYCTYCTYTTVSFVHFGCTLSSTVPRIGQSAIKEGDHFIVTLTIDYDDDTLCGVSATKMETWTNIIAYQQSKILDPYVCTYM